MVPQLNAGLFSHWQNVVDPKVFNTCPWRSAKQINAAELLRIFYIITAALRFFRGFQQATVLVHHSLKVPFGKFAKSGDAVDRSKLLTDTKDAWIRFCGLSKTRVTFQASMPTGAPAFFGCCSFFVLHFSNSSTQETPLLCNEMFHCMGNFKHFEHSNSPCSKWNHIK